MRTFTRAGVVGLASATLVLTGAAAIAAQAPGPAPIPESALVARIGRIVDSLASRGEFSGVVVLAKDSAMVFQRAYGMADRTARRSNDVETAFNLGSINKVFTATAIRQLAIAGKLDLDSTVGRYWPDYPNAEVARKVTIRQLLNFRSGIGGDIFGLPASGRRSSIRALADYLPLFVNEPLEFEPGSREKYSNAGYVVLGLLVERLSGQDYYTYVRDHVYAPAGMTRTAHYAVDSLPRNTAIGYTHDEPAAGDSVRANASILPGRGSSAGGGYSTAQDLVRFLRAIRARRIPGSPPAGLGVAGGTAGVNATLDGQLPGGYDLVVLANLDPPAAERVARAVRALLHAD
jgi:CubicO group peptidase (beta-lactamase class C family)